jgi:transcription-repair coupling factor (superfamily II helicase)
MASPYCGAALRVERIRGPLSCRLVRAPCPRARGGGAFCIPGSKAVPTAPPTRLAELARRLAARTAPVRVGGLRGGARAAVIARLVEAHPGAPALVLTAGAKETDRLVADLGAALGEGEGGRVRPFPHPDALPYDRFSPQPLVVAQRMDVLHRLANWGRRDWRRESSTPDAGGVDPGPGAPGDPRAGAEPPPVIVAPWSALAWRVPSREAVREATVRVARGDRVDRDALVARLVGAGYARQAVVEERGEVAVRGGIVDVFPPQRVHPVRIELLGDEVESLRDFDPASQRSQVELPAFVAPPPREILATRELVVERAGAIRTRGLAQGLPSRALDALLDALLRGALPPGSEAMAALLQPALESFLDFVPEGALVAIDEPDTARERLERFSVEALEGFAGTKGGERVVCEPGELLVPSDALVAATLARRPVQLERLETEGAEAVHTTTHDDLSHRLREARGAAAPLRPLLAALEAWRREGLAVAIAAPALSGAERLRTLLGEYALDTRLERVPAPAWQWSAPGEVAVRVMELSAGFVLRDDGLVAITEEELFGPREPRRRATSFRDAAALEALGEIAPGDRLVHAEHGIGIYRGLVLLEVGRIREEMLRIEYADGDRLFVPAHRLNLVQRYVSGDGPAPELDKLGGTSWERTKTHVRRRLRDMAKELLAVHAARELQPGFAFPPRDRALEEFEAAFPYEETPDQAAAIEDVLADLARARPMDRLVCGDVGYGKTEVAARAAHQAVMAGKQVAVLVPTTVLCQQHAETFRRRFEGLPVTIASLSRFETGKEARAVRAGLASGKIDLVIGTHALLQKDVAFHDLGLLVVDEEHRFGVAHKEKIKKLKETVDVLTLTATPIPRTLQMAFAGLRDLSVIQTPPPDRIAVRTQVSRFDESLVREAILREVRRGGQVYFVHNRVRTIGSLAELLGKLVPEVRVVVAHGQMPERELEDKMLAFVRGDFDVLLCTTIIESGLDLPRVNTIVIDRADALGLAQLYQLRGRVGRSKHRAYAYLLIPSEQAMSDEAKRRLEAIQDLSALGSGFRLASMDLEIRGAGNLLGAEQHGNLAAVGFDTYLELLEQEIERLRGGEPAPEVDPEIRLPIPARLPEEYVADVRQRLVLYKRLAGAPDAEAVERLADELLDRFGPLPLEARNLLGVIRLKVAARALGIASVALEDGQLVLGAAAASRVDPARLVALVRRRGEVEVLPDQRVRAPAPDRSADALLARAHWLIGELAGAGAGDVL